MSGAGYGQMAGILGLAAFLVIGLIGLLLLALWVWMLVDCLQREFRDSITKAIWVLVILFASWVGAVIYWAIGRPQGTRASRS